MRQRIGAILTVIVACCSLSLTSCKPTYPKCESDDHCKEKGEVCINGACQECRVDPDCVKKNGAGFVCVDSRCEAQKVTATPAAECTKSEDCAAGSRCDGQKCVSGCTVDQECGPGMVCQGGSCVAQGTKVSAACRPMDAASGDLISVSEVNFDFDKFDIRVDARSTLDADFECLKQAPEVRVIVEGHCDDRGTQEYNLALGEKRADAVMSYLRRAGIPAARMTVRSKGENEPLCREATEECYGQNRRVKFIQSRGK
jgi:peptidoglycan-associated lipoprotein